ncbi:MAG: CBS domain-containing protein [Chloroflexi bacterium]|nr:MAG: CBS domain-containing protein [Chloroflexota bacterium]
MFVRDRMSSPVVTVTPDTPFQEALQMMQEKKFRRLPVVDNKGKLIGIISERDCLYASPSPATSLSVWEMNYMLSKIKVERLMTREVITTTPDTTLEDAAHKMVIQRVGGLPVVDEDGIPVGIITETDIFKTLVEMFAGGQPGLRLTLAVPRKKGVLAMLSEAIFELNGNILAVGAYDLPDPDKAGLVVKVEDVSKDQLVKTLEALGDQVIDARECC